MQTKRTMIATRFKQAAVACLFLGLVASCTRFNPVPLDQLDYLARLEIQEKEGIKVGVAVLTRDEARQAFGKKLDDLHIQPVWIEIENNSNRDYLLMLHGVDPDYYSEAEAAAAVKGGTPSTRQAIDDYFENSDIDTFVQPGQTNAGFVFTNLKQGTKQVRVRLLGEKELLDFEFFIEVPGLRADWQRGDVDSLYLESEITDYQDPREFRQVLENFQCCTTKKNGDGSGDPINLVIIARPDSLRQFIAAGWDETEVMSVAAGWRTFKAFITSGEYKNSPISALYVFQRPQDLSLQKARDTIHERNHLRLWQAPWRFRGDEVWIGGISRDIGVFFTTRTWNLTTHAIDSEVDEARNYLLEDLATAQSVGAFSMVDGVGLATRESPRSNLLGTPWWTDGRRLVMFLANDPVALDEMEVLDWARERQQ
jgi:hypothetical protein